MDPLTAGLGLGTSLLSAIFGNKAAKKTNKINQAQLDLQKKLADNQISVSDYIQGLSKQLMAQGSNQVDPYGGTTGYDPVTGTYKSTLGAVPQGLQNASDAEELARYTQDQAMRRQGLTDSEAIRHGAVTDALSASQDAANFRRGIGTVDAGSLGAQMRTDREGAINAGYDDAMRAAQTLQTRTGSSAVGDALTALARSRAAAHSAVGSPEVEALQLAQGINSQRQNDIATRYAEAANRGQNFYDANFTSAPYAGLSDAKIGDQQKFDLSKYEVAQGGSATAAAGIGSAAAGIRQAFSTAEQNRVKNPTGDLIAGIGGALGGASKAGLFQSLFG